jgi:ketosteroid isomerase-like protein
MNEYSPIKPDIMKTKLLLMVMLTSLLYVIGCSGNDAEIEGSASLSTSSTASKSAVTHQTYPQAQKEVLATFGAIAQSIKDGAGNGYDGPYMDQLISFHAYGDKFTEFNEGQLYDSAGNEHNERTLFGETVDPGGVKKFDAVPGTLKVAVYYGNVANLTFISDFILEIGGVEYTINHLITLLFVKTKGEWKMVHEHHSPAAVEGGSQGSGVAHKSSLSKSSSGFKSAVTDQDYPQAQADVLETFGAIAQSISAGAGNGYDGPYMDQLISFHAYGDKFTEFNDGKLYDSAGNEHNERSLFGETVDPGGVKQFAPLPGTLKVAVYYGNVANVTFISDFILQIDGVENTFNNLITLLFVKTNDGWKMVHEHHSPFQDS